MKGAMRFRKSGKLIPRCIRPFGIIRIVEEVAYELTLPTNFSVIHLAFHMSMLLRYTLNFSQVLHWDFFQFYKRLAFVEELVSILARDMRRLHSRDNIMVKV